MRAGQLLTLAFSVVSATAFCVPSIRREWRTFSRPQKKAFLDAVKCLGNTPHDPALVPTGGNPDIPPMRSTNTSYYDDLVYVHMDMAKKIHATGFFLPWHRMFLYMFERGLKDKCSYEGTLPYWDWTQDHQDFANSPIFDPDPEVGFGSWGSAADDFQIRDGALGLDNPHPFYVSYPVRHVVRRNFTLQPYLNFPPQHLLRDPAMKANETFTRANVDEAVQGNTGDFKGFSWTFSDYQGPHAGVHLIVGADLTGTCPANAPNCKPGETWSPNDPLFFLHHAMVDKAWSDWQRRDQRNALAFEGGETQALYSLEAFRKYPSGAPPNLSLSSPLKTDGLTQQYRIIDMMSTTSPFLCYNYQ